MSFILDALKKSEMDRQRQTVPGLMDAASAPPRARFPVWAIVLCALFGVNLIVILLFVMRHGAGVAAPGNARTSGGVSAPIAREGPTEHFSPMDNAPNTDSPPTYAPEIPLPAGESTVQSPKPADTAHASRRADPLLTDATTKREHDEAKPENEEVLPSLSELNLTGTQELAELHLDVHVYATNPQDRFVYINMRKYREGNRLQEGPTVERIRRDGVVLDYQGLRFLLPRQ
jgi:general secretion pathway protein B